MEVEVDGPGISGWEGGALLAVARLRLGLGLRLRLGLGFGLGLDLGGTSWVRSGSGVTNGPGTVVGTVKRHPTLVAVSSSKV